MTKFSKTLIIVSTALLLAAGCNPWSRPQPLMKAEPVSTTTEARVPGAQTSFFYAGIKGETAMSLLKLYHKVETKDFGSGMGEFVTTIDGIKPDADEFWAFYVNGKSSTVGASTYQTKENDQIEWRLEKIRN